MIALKQTPLYQQHVFKGAKMIDFAGWHMPLHYTSIFDEHLCVRSKVGMFDLSHMGQFILTGANAKNILSYLTSNNPCKLQIGEIQYTLLLNNSGGIVDDILVYKIPNGYYLVVNAANIEKDFQWISEHLEGDVFFENISDETALIAIQGKFSSSVIENVFSKEITSLKYYTHTDTIYQGATVKISRTGYTGEDGYEIYMSNRIVEPLWQELLEKGDKYGLRLIGLGARDTLRLEMRMPLYGNDIDDSTSPLEAGLRKVIKFKKGEFIGKDKLLAEKEIGVSRKLVAFVMEGRGIARQGYIITKNDEEIGHVTSGTMSPSLRKAIGMGYIKKEFANQGEHLNIKIRNKSVSANLIKGRFVQVKK